MDKSLKQLSRIELLELLVKLSEENEALVAENSQLKQSHVAKPSMSQTAKVGSIAELALQANGYFEAVQRSADDYLREIKRMRDQLAARANSAVQAPSNARRAVSTAGQRQVESVGDAQAQAQAIVGRAKSQAEAILAEARSKSETMLTDASRKSRSIISRANHQADAVIQAARTDAEQRQASRSTAQSKKAGGAGNGAQSSSRSNQPAQAQDRKAHQGQSHAQQEKKVVAEDGIGNRAIAGDSTPARGRHARL